MNLPNKLTMARILLVPVFMVFASMTRYNTEGYTAAWYLAAGVVFAVASFTDYLDGHLARKWHLITDFGKFADPLADKLLTKTVLQMLSIIFYYFAAALAGPTDTMAVCLISSALCWLVAAVTAISGIKYLVDNRHFINTAK